jgi:hypothetical protein
MVILFEKPLKSNSTYCISIFTWINSISVRRVTRRQNCYISNNNIAAKKEEILELDFNSVSMMHFWTMVTIYELRTLLILGVFQCQTRVSVQHCTTSIITLSCSIFSNYYLCPHINNSVCVVSVFVLHMWPFSLSKWSWYRENENVVKYIT